MTIARIMAFSLGALSLYGLPQLLPFYVPWFFLLPGIGLLFGALTGRLREGLIIGLFFFAGFSYAHSYASWQLQQRASWPETGWRDTLAGCVLSLPDIEKRRTRFLFRLIEDAPEAGLNKGQIVRIDWYQPSLVRAGQCWRLTVKLREPHGMQNPGTFDYEAWLFANHVVATATVVESEMTHLLPHRTRLTINPIREKIADFIDLHVANTLGAALIRGLAIGDRRGFDADLWRILRETGTGHLFAISGLHIGMMAFWVFWLVNGLWSRSYHFTQRLPAQQAAAVAALIAAGLYALVAGWSVPTQRALVMLTVGLGAMTSGRQVSPWFAWALAMFLVLLLEPLAALTPGFWLSFLAVGWILFFAMIRPPQQSIKQHAIWHKLVRLVQFQLIVVIGLVPLGLGFFSGFSLVAPIVNLIAIPVFSLLIVPAVFITLVLAAIMPAWADSVLSLPAELLLTFVDGLDILIKHFKEQVYWTRGQPQLLVILLAILATAIFCLPKGVPGKALAVLLWLPALFVTSSVPATGEVNVTMLDVGQGLAIVVRTRNHVMLYDLGPGTAEGWNAGSAIIVPYLHHKGIYRIDRVVLSHSDQSHQGGLEAVLNEFDQFQLMANHPLDIANERFPCLAGQSWQWDKVSFSVIHPAQAQDWNVNDGGCVLLIETGEQSALLMADNRHASERNLLKKWQEHRPVSVLVVANHGSHTASWPQWVASIRPQVALISAARGNRWGMPRKEVIERYHAVGADVLTTAKGGALTATLSALDTPVRMKSWRHTGRRYWWSPGNASTPLNIE